MRVFYSPQTLIHRSPYEIWNGGQDKHQEVPERAETILEALQDDGNFKISDVTQTIPSVLLERIHEPGYVQFIREACEQLQGEDYRYPSVFPLRAQDQLPANTHAAQGFYTFDMYTPLLRATYSSALASASLAWQLAQDLQSGNLRTGYALCRPPGHHAEPNQMGGYCYFNNAAVAAEYLSDFGKVAVLDVDFHHGNGTQHIFYDRADVLTISIHADPAWKFPYFSGNESEVGVGEGEGYNQNYLLNQGTTNEQYQEVLERACERIAEFAPDYLVVAFGADTFVGDPIGGFALTTEYFQTMGKTIADLRIPAAIVQEGGYNCAELGTNVVSFLSGFR